MKQQEVLYTASINTPPHRKPHCTARIHRSFAGRTPMNAVRALRVPSDRRPCKPGSDACLARRGSTMRAKGRGRITTLPRKAMLREVLTRRRRMYTCERRLLENAAAAKSISDRATTAFTSTNLLPIVEAGAACEWLLTNHLSPRSGLSFCLSFYIVAAVASIAIVCTF